jgi:replicative DNA helicase
MADPLVPNTILIKDLVDQLISDSEMVAAARASGRASGPITGFKSLDALLGGYFCPGLHILQSGSGVGKTALALQIASMCGFPALFVSMETSVLELFRRLIARTTKTALERLKTGELSANAIAYLAKQTIEYSPTLAIMDATTCGASVDQILEVSTSLRDWAGSNRILVVIDSLHFWSRPEVEFAKGASEQDFIANTIKCASELAARLSSPVLALSHKNRLPTDKVQQAGTHPNVVSQSAFNKVVDYEYFAETVLELTKDKELKTDATSVKSSLTLMIRKNRHGGLGNVSLDFTGQFQLFNERL